MLCKAMLIIACIVHTILSLCLDIIDCVNGSNLCDQICNELEGGYSCSCKNGYRLKNDNFSCEGMYMLYIASCVVICKF